MTEGIVRIYLSHKEPSKELLWLRPKLDEEGYDLLYWGSNGWTPLIGGVNNLPIKSTHNC